jgi:hypothetical protein
MRQLVQTRLGMQGNCWQTCVAMLLDVDPATMPQQFGERTGPIDIDPAAKDARPYFTDALQRYLRKHHNLAYVEVHGPGELHQFIVPRDRQAPHMMTGRTARSDSLNGVRHVVVARAGELLWDPHPTHLGLTEELRYAFLVPWPKSWTQYGGEPCICPACLVEVSK